MVRSNAGRPAADSRASGRRDGERLLGAHVSARGGLPAALQRAGALGCNCMQIFASNPRSWNGPAPTPGEGLAYRRGVARSGVRAAVVHAIYLVNLASPKAEVVARSRRSVIRDLRAAAVMDARGLVLHPGSDLGEGGGEDRLIRHLAAVLRAVPAGPRVLLEGMAGTRHSLGDFATLGRVGARLGRRVGYCLDTAHLCASGYDLAGNFTALVRDLNRHLDVSRVGCLHVNDSRHPVGSRRDQHANLLEGVIGRRGFVRMLAHPPFRHLPAILETPGFDRAGPDRLNLRRLRALAREADGAPSPGRRDASARASGREETRRGR